MGPADRGRQTLAGPAVVECACDAHQHTGSPARERHRRRGRDVPAPASDPPRVVRRAVDRGDDRVVAGAQPIQTTDQQHPVAQLEVKVGIVVRARPRRALAYDASLIQQQASENRLDHAPVGGAERRALRESLDRVVGEADPGEQAAGDYLPNTSSTAPTASAATARPAVTA